MPAEQLPVTVHCSAACIVSLIGFYVRINLCKSLELDRLRANLPSNVGRVSAQNIYTPNKLHKERLISFVCLFFLSCKSLLELQEADLWRGRPSWWLQRGSDVGPQRSGWYQELCAVSLRFAEICFQ